MNSQELRLGNWVNCLEILKFDRENPIRPVRLNIDDLKVIERGDKLDRFTGVPITVQILDKCLENINGVSWGSEEFTIADSDGIWDIYCNHTFIRSVEYLHELQNGYAWIMQKELEVEL
jgi:hypothetical protein